MARCVRYARVSELGSMLRESGGGRPRIYVLPSHSRDDILDELLSGGAGWFGERPSVWSWPELYRELADPHRSRRQIDPPDHRLIVRYVADQVISEMDAERYDVPAGARRRGFVDVLADAASELMLEGITPAMLDDDGSVVKDELMRRFYILYLDYLEAHGLADNSQVPALALKDMSAEQAERILKENELVWIGFMSFTGAQMHLINRLNDIADPYGGMLFYVPDSGLPDFKDAVEQLGMTIPTSQGFGGRIERIAAASPIAEMDAAARAASAVMRGEAPFERLGAGDLDCSDIGMLVPVGMGEAAAAALRRAGVPCQLRSETASRETPIVETALAAYRAYAAGLKTDTVLDLLELPLLGLTDQCAAIEEAARRMLPEGEESWREILTGRGRAAEVFDRLMSFCRSLDDADGKTAEELLIALESLFGDEELRMTAEGAADITELDGAVRKVYGALREIREKLRLFREMTPPIGEAGQVRFRGREAAAFISEWSAMASVPLSQMMSGAVTIYDSPPPVLVSHAVWIMTGVDASRYPGMMSEGRLVDGRVRELVNSRDQDVHLPTLREKRMQREALFRRLICIGEAGTILIRSSYDSDGRQLSESSLIASIASSNRWEISAEHDDMAVVRARPAHSPRGAYPRTARSEPGVRIDVSVSRIDDWAACPYMFFVSRHLTDGRSRDKDARSPLARGVIVHELWDRVWDRLRSMPPDARPTVRAVAEDEWPDVVSKLAGKYPFLVDPRRRSATEAVRRIAMEHASVQDEIEARARAAGLARVDIAHEVTLEPYEMEHVTFSARVDRVDLWDAGSVIVDYKLGDATSSRYKDSLQLAAYSVMLKASGEDASGLVYLGMRAKNARGVWRDESLKSIYGDSGKKDAKSIDEKMEDALDAMRGIDECARTGVWQARTDGTACERCSLWTLCRRGEFRGEAERGDDGDQDGGYDDR